MYAAVITNSYPHDLSSPMAFLLTLILESRLLSRLNSLFGTLLEIARRETPIDQFVENSVEVIRASVLVIQVVGMFPHVDGQ